MGLLVLSGILVITVALRFCPLYKAFGFFTPSAGDNLSRNRYWGRSLRFFGWLVWILMTHHFLIRPWFLDWGAPQKIQELTLSGDHFTDGGHHSRAVLIDASPDVLWPWIMQLGQERGGFYSYTFLENLFRADMHNVYAWRPELQQPRLAGDTIWLADEERYNGAGYQIVAQINPYESFVMVGGEDYARIVQGQKAKGLWAIYLYPEDRKLTWLIARSSNSPGMPRGDRFLRYLTFEVPHFIMEQKMLRTVKHLAEK